MSYSTKPAKTGASEGTAARALAAYRSRVSPKPPWALGLRRALVTTRFAWSSAPRVVTSARRDPKASGGFGDTLLRYAASARAALPADLPVLLSSSHNAA